MSMLDRLLNHISMYRLMLYYAAGLLAVAFALGFFKLAPQDATALVFSTVLILAACWLTNCAFALLLRVPANAESVYITALILALIMPPVTATNLPGVAGLVLASVTAIGSKFLLAIGRKHLFNPVAVGVMVSSLALDQSATWWVGGNLWLLPAVLLGGLLVVRKVQRFDMLAAYILANLATTLATTAPDHYVQALRQTLLYSPLLFAGFAMLTEPLTATHSVWGRLTFGALIGALASPNIHYGDIYLAPEHAFLAGNLFAWAVSPKGRTKLTLLRIETAAAGCLDFVFKPDRRIEFRPGQYLDWTLAVRSPDDRGNRRPFTIASAPGEPELRLGVKLYPQPSAFKQSLAAMKPGDVIWGSQLAGAFCLPGSRKRKLAFIAGGIGITPFRSMLSDLIERGDTRNATLLYGVNRADEIAYGSLLDRAERELGIRTTYAIAEGELPETNAYRGFIDEAMIRRAIPDFKERIFYLSGPRSMVVRFQALLGGLGIARSRIRVDYFPGFA